MKYRAFRHLTRGIPRELLGQVFKPRKEESWERTQADRLPARDLVDQISEQNLSAMDAREHLIWCIGKLRHDLRRRRHAGLSSKIGTKLIERMRHMLDHWPDPRVIGVIELQAFKTDVDMDRFLTPEPEPSIPLPNFKKAA